MSIEENQLITKVVREKDYSAISNNFLDDSYFETALAEFHYLRDYFDKYNSTPTAEQLTQKFPHFDYVDSPTNFKSVIDALKEQRLFRKCVDVINNASKRISQDSNEGVKYLLSRIGELKSTDEISCVDMMHDKERLAVWEDRKKHQSEIYIETPFKELNEYVYGYQRGSDLFLWLAKSGIGKSQILSSSAAQACLDGNRVLVVSPEMSSIEMQYRVDTYITHMSNIAMQKGLQIDGYKEYVEEMYESDKHLFVADMTDFNRKITVSKIEQLINQVHADIVFIDGIKYVRPDFIKKGQSEAEIEGDVGVELLSISSQYKIPVVGVVQARRRQNESKNNEQVDLDAESMSGSYFLAQVATRIVTIQRKAGAIQLGIPKNRYGLDGKKLLYSYDYDKLIFDYIPDLEDIANDEEAKQEVEEMKEAFKNMF